MESWMALAGMLSLILLLALFSYLVRQIQRQRVMDQALCQIYKDNYNSYQGLITDLEKLGVIVLGEIKIEIGYGIASPKPIAKVLGLLISLNPGQKEMERVIQAMLDYSIEGGKLRTRRYREMKILVMDQIFSKRFRRQDEIYLQYNFSRDCAIAEEDWRETARLIKERREEEKISKNREVTWKKALASQNPDKVLPATAAEGKPPTE